MPASSADTFVFSAGDYVAVIVVAIAAFAVLLAAATWALSEDERIDRVGISGIFVRFFLPAIIPVLIQFVATAGILYRCDQVWVQSRVIALGQRLGWSGSQTVDTTLAYLFLALAFALPFSAWIVPKLGFESVQYARYRRIVDTLGGPRGGNNPQTPTAPR